MGVLTFALSVSLACGDDDDSDTSGDTGTSTTTTDASTSSDGGSSTTTNGTTGGDTSSGSTSAGDTSGTDSGTGTTGDDVVTCSLAYDLPADIPVDITNASQADFDSYSWHTFLALNAPTVGGSVNLMGDNLAQWEGWSSTADLLNLGDDPGPSGTRYYPEACKTIPDYTNYRALSQVGKVDDSFEEAANGKLSNDPVIDSAGNFLRYEIMLSPATYNWVVAEGFNKESVLQQQTADLSFTCGQPSYQGGDPASPMMGSLVLKLAWMQLGTRDASKYHTEDILVFTPGYRNTTGEDSCALQKMALVGMHIAHKTERQPNWIWSTFEHSANAPSCSTLPPVGNQGAGGVNPGPSKGCPATIDKQWNFNAPDCTNSEACQTCNTAPLTNQPADMPDACINPEYPNGTAWCVDYMPASTHGRSQLCRQVDVATYYPDAHAQNEACAAALGTTSTWSNYQLISTQWYNQPLPAGCPNVSATLKANKDRAHIVPTIPVGKDGGERPYLANTSMESYERADCTGCHLNAAYKNSMSVSIDTDLMYWIQLEVPAADN